MTQISDPFTDFTRARASDLRRIANQTRGEQTFGDVVGEAYLIINRIHEKRGTPLDLYSPIDQDEILGWLYNEVVKFADKSIRYAVKLDKNWDSDDPDALINVLERFLAAPEESDPLVQILREESRFDPLSLVEQSYSQTAAYIILLQRFNWSLKLLADHLQQLVDTVRRKILASSLLMKIQPSLFDGTAKIALDFIPYARNKYPRATINNAQCEQFCWQLSSGWSPKRHIGICSDSISSISTPKRKRPPLLEAVNSWW